MPGIIENQQPVVAVDQDPAVGQAALENLAKYLGAIAESDLVMPNVDTTRAALKVIAACTNLSPELLARFAGLPAGEFDLSKLQVLESSARAVLHTRAQLAAAQAVDPNLRMPAALAQKATDLRETMLQVLGYHLGRDPDGEHGDAVRELQHVRGGIGHADLARDLLVLGKLYRRFAAVLSRDTIRYRAADADEAEKLAASIQEHLGRKQQRKRTPEQLLAAQAWTLMVRTYEDVAATGRWLTRNDPAAADIFPSLGESRRRRRQPVETAAPVTSTPTDGE